MSRHVIVAAAQLGPIERNETRSSVIDRMISLMEQAAHKGCQLIVYPELALTTFFPRWHFENDVDIDKFFETEMPNENTMRLFQRAKDFKMGFYLGYAEKESIEGRTRRFNSAVLVNGYGDIVHKYRKVHLPGHANFEPERAFQHLEKRYFEPGRNYFSSVSACNGQIALAICNDRRWPEVYREATLRGAEMLLVGYNTPVHNPEMPRHDHLQNFHSHLVMQAGAYQNGLWVVGAAKAGNEEGWDMIGQSCIIAPTGEIVSVACSLGDEIVFHKCDFERCREVRDHIFSFARHRRPEMYPLLSHCDSNPSS